MARTAAAIAVVGLCAALIVVSRPRMGTVSVTALEDHQFGYLRSVDSRIQGVRTLPVIDWKLPHGTYAFEIENHAEGSLLGSTPVEHYATVSEAQSIEGQTILVLDGGIHVRANDVIALRNPAD